MTSLYRHIEEITGDIWRTLFDLPLEPGCGESGLAAPVTALVHVQGAWDGAVMLQCPPALAATLASAMFQAAHEPDEDEVRDAVGEIANMVAGNVKALLPGPCSISLPTVALGSDYEVSVVGTRPEVVVPFTCDGHPVTVTVLRSATAKVDAW